MKRTLAVYGNGWIDCGGRGYHHENGMRFYPVVTMTKAEDFSTCVVAVYLVLSGAEWLYLLCRKTRRWFSGPQAISLRFQDRTLNPNVDRVASPRTLHMLASALACVLVVGGLALFVDGFTGQKAVALRVSLTVTLWSFNFAFATGLEGSDQMAALVMLAQLLACLKPASSVSVYMFITGQLILSYVVSGAAKFISPFWRSGDAIVMILSTRSFGTGGGDWLKHNRWGACFLCWLTIVFELSWLVTPLFPRFTLFLMLATAMFHFANSWIMGLNLFPWAFISAFPLALSTIKAGPPSIVRQWMHI